MAHEYFINGERADKTMAESGDEVARKKRKREQLFNYMTATLVQYVLILQMVISFIASFGADDDKRLTRYLIGTICLAFIGTIAAIKTLVYK